MPLRARVDGHWVLAPLVAADKWRVLAADLRAGRRLATLPCCDGLAFGRTSGQGLAHFVHQRREGCAAGRESVEHLALKSAVLRACQEAGWTVEAEVVGPHWRADVLATPRLATTLEDVLGGHHHRPPWRVAFEVQLSRIDGATLLERQERYARDRVRGCWLVGSGAVGKRRPLATGADITARLGLPPATPAFALLPGEGPIVDRAGCPIPLDAFVAALLGRQVRFAASMTPEAHPLRALIYEAWCPSCGARCHPHLIVGWFVAACGARGPLRRTADEGALTTSLEFDPVALAAVRAHAASPAGRDPRSCPVGPAGADGRMAFHCPACGRALPASHLAHAAWPVRRGEASPVATVPLPTLAGLNCAVELPHWCLGEDGAACADSAVS